jgi:hypothetical protein
MGGGGAIFILIINPAHHERLPKDKEMKEKTTGLRNEAFMPKKGSPAAD